MHFFKMTVKPFVEGFEFLRGFTTRKAHKVWSEFTVDLVSPSRRTFTLIPKSIRGFQNFFPYPRNESETRHLLLLLKIRLERFQAKNSILSQLFESVLS